jgi:hypothetical protein
VLVARRHRLETDLRAVDGQLTRLRASSWSAIEAKDGSWSVEHADGRRRCPGFSAGEAASVAAALNSLRRVRTVKDVFVRGQSVAAGVLFDLPANEARTLVAGKSAEFVA